MPRIYRQRDSGHVSLSKAFIEASDKASRLFPIHLLMVFAISEGIGLRRCDFETPFFSVQFHQKTQKLQALPAHRRLHRRDFTDASQSTVVANTIKQMIGKSLDALSDASMKRFEKRNMTGITLSINPRHLPEAFEMIDEFKRKLETRLSRGKCSEVYQIGTCSFSISLIAVKDKEPGKREPTVTKG